MKAQIGQVFIYVMTLVLVSFVLFYGYKAISSFNQKADQVSFIQMKNSLENTVETLSLEYGSVKVREFIAPENTEEICFVRNFPETPTLQDTSYPLIEDSINSGVEDNVFLIGEGVEQSFILRKVSMEEDMLCLPVLQGKINIRLEGRGDHTIISSNR